MNNKIKETTSALAACGVLLVSLIACKSNSSSVQTSNATSTATNPAPPVIPETKEPSCSTNKGVQICMYPDGTFSAVSTLYNYTGDLASYLQSGGMTNIGHIETYDCPTYRAFYTTGMMHVDGKSAFVSVVGMRSFANNDTAAAITNNSTVLFAIKDALFSCRPNNSGTSL